MWAGLTQIQLRKNAETTFTFPFTVCGKGRKMSSTFLQWGLTISEIHACNLYSMHEIVQSGKETFFTGLGWLNGLTAEVDTNVSTLSRNWIGKRT